MSEKTKDPGSRKNRTLTFQPGGRSSLLHDPSRHLRLHRCENEVGNASDCDVILSQHAYLKIMRHLSADTKREHGGLLLGLRERATNSTPSTILILTSLAGEHTRGDPVSLTFTENTWLKFQEETDELDRLGVKLQRLGWYHSHPGLGIFLSRWDLDVCTNFDQPHHVALVVDPVRSRGGFFPRGEHGYRPHEPKGFWEYADLKAESLIEWENTHEVSNEWRLPAYELLPFQILEEETETEAETEAEIDEKAAQPEPELTYEAAEQPIVDVPQFTSTPAPEQTHSTSIDHENFTQPESTPVAVPIAEPDKKSRFAFVKRTATKIGNKLKPIRRTATD